MSEHLPLQRQVDPPAPVPLPVQRTLGDYIDDQRFRAHVFEIRKNGVTVLGLGVYTSPDGFALVDPHDGYSWFMSEEEMRAAEVVRCLNATITYRGGDPVSEPIPRDGIQVKVADDLDVMSLEELCQRYNTQRATISTMVDEARALTEKARRLDAILAALDV